MKSEKDPNDRLLVPLAAATFLIFFSGYMIAPLIPGLAREFGVSVQEMGWVVPAYMLTYGFSTLVYGPLSDRLGRGPVLLSVLLLLVAVTAGVPFVTTFRGLIAMRVLSGLCVGGILPIALALLGDLYPYAKLGRPMGWMFGAVAGGMAFGSTLGAWLNPIIGWRREFFGVAVLDAIVFAMVLGQRRLIPPRGTARRSVGEIVLGYFAILKAPRALGVFALVFTNGMFHSGAFSWLGFYLSQRYNLSDSGIGRTLLGYGIPGMFLGPTIGKLADRFGRRRIIPAGFALAALCAFALIPVWGLFFVTLTVTLLSVGFDMSHPLMAGVVTSLDPPRRGQAMGLNAFAIFTGYGLGSLVFQLLLRDGLGLALAVFGTGQLLLSVVATRVFRAEVATARPPR